MAKRDLRRLHKQCEGVKPHSTLAGYGSRLGQILDFYCEKHKVVICKCGWEWGWHAGTRSKLLVGERYAKSILEQAGEEKGEEGTPRFRGPR